MKKPRNEQSSAIQQRNVSQAPAGALDRHACDHELYARWTDEQTDDLIARIATGERVAEIAASYGVTRWAVLRHLYSDPHRSARARDAQACACLLWDQAAEDVIRNAPADPVEMQRARELAQHYRWRAARLAPTVYGDRVEIVQDAQLAAVPPADLMAATVALAREYGLADRLMNALAGPQGRVINGEPVATAALPQADGASPIESDAKDAKSRCR